MNHCQCNHRGYDCGRGRPRCWCDHGELREAVAVKRSKVAFDRQPTAAAFVLIVLSTRLRASA